MLLVCCCNADFCARWGQMPHAAALVPLVAALLAKPEEGEGEEGAAEGE